MPTNLQQALDDAIFTVMEVTGLDEDTVLNAVEEHTSFLGDIEDFYESGTKAMVAAVMTTINAWR